MAKMWMNPIDSEPSNRATEAGVMASSSNNDEYAGAPARPARKILKVRSDQLAPH
jgi:hypothetical protein